MPLLSDASRPEPRADRRSSWRARFGDDPQLALLLGLISFLVMFAYASARPVRDEIAANIDSDTRAALWKWTFAVNVLLAPVYAWIASRATRARLLGGMLLGSGACALGFAWLAGALSFDGWGYAGLDGRSRVWMESTFYVWLSVFVMFVVSATWSLASDLYRTETARSVFGPVAAATSLGGVVGAWSTVGLSDAGVGAGPILLIVAVALAAACLPLWAVERRRITSEVDVDAPTAIGGTVFSGFAAVVRSRYLLAIAGFILLMTLANTVFYFAQSELARSLFDDRTARRAFLGRIDLWVNAFSLVGQLGVIGFVMRRAGLSMALAGLPVLAAGGFAALGWLEPRLESGALTGTSAALALGVLLGAQRVGRYAFARPAREALFTLVTRDERFKSKSFIDTAVYRGGDVLWSEAYSVLEAGGMAVAGIALTGLPLVGVWLAGAVWLGRTAERRAAAADCAT